MSRSWVWLSGFGIGFLTTMWLFTGMISEAGKIVGETDTYSRDMGFETRLFYVAAGSDGAGKVEYVCKAFPGTTGSDDTSSSVWQVTRLTYDTDDKVSTVAYAGDDDGFNQICDNRVSLNYN